MSFEQETNDTLVFGASIVTENSDESILDFCHCLAKKNGRNCGCKNKQIL